MHYLVKRHIQGLKDKKHPFQNIVQEPSTAMRVNSINVESKIVNNYLSISLSICLGCSKELSRNHLIETVLLSTHNICLSWEIKIKISIMHSYLEARDHLSKGLIFAKIAYLYI